MATRLRAAGFPEKFVRAAIAAEHERRSSARSIQRAPDYWRANSSPDAKEEAAERQREREEQKALERLIGDEGMAEEAREFLTMQFGELPPEKLARVYRVQRDYNELRQQIHDENPNPLAPAVQERLHLLEKEMRADVAKLLNPEELLHYELRSSPTAQTLRALLYGFNATEAEYRALFAMRRPLDEQLPIRMHNESPEQIAARQTAEQAFDEQVKALLGPTRYADYALAARAEVGQLKTLVARLELPLASAAQVMAVQKDIQQRVAAARNNRALAPAERDAQLAALAKEAADKVTATLGRRGFEGYQLNGGGWLQNIVPRGAPKQ